MNLTYRILARINNILHYPNQSITSQQLKSILCPQNIKNFVKNEQNNQFLYDAFALSRLLEIHQGSVMQYIFNFYTTNYNMIIPNEPMLEFLRVDSLVLPFADNIATNIFNTIISDFVHKIPQTVDMNFYIQTFSLLDTTPFIFFYHPYFDNLNIRNEKLNDALTFSDFI